MHATGFQILQLIIINSTIKHKCFDNIKHSKTRYIQKQDQAILNSSL